MVESVQTDGNYQFCRFSLEWHSSTMDDHIEYLFYSNLYHILELRTWKHCKINPLYLMQVQLKIFEKIVFLSYKIKTLSIDLKFVCYLYCSVADANMNWYVDPADNVDTKHIKIIIYTWYDRNSPISIKIFSIQSSSLDSTLISNRTTIHFQIQISIDMYSLQWMFLTAYHLMKLFWYTYMFLLYFINVNEIWQYFIESYIKIACFGLNKKILLPQLVNKTKSELLALFVIRFDDCYQI